MFVGQSGFDISQDYQVGHLSHCQRITLQQNENSYSLLLIEKALDKTEKESAQAPIRMEGDRTPKGVHAVSR